MTVVTYISRQGGMRSLQLHNLACKLIVRGTAHFSSLRVKHVPGVLNEGADLLSRGNPLYGECALEVVDQIWKIHGRATVYLFALQANAKRPLYFSLRDEKAPLSADELAHQWPNVRLYAYKCKCTRASPEVINTIQSTRTPSARSLYDVIWHVFEDWHT